MKLLSDFDGVWTDPAPEAHEQGRCLDALLVSWMPGADRERAARWVREARAAAGAAPQRYGWAPGGRLSAFGDEDPFAPHGALLHFIGERAAHDPTAAALLAAAAAHGFADLDAVGGHAHAQGVARVAAARGPALLAAAAGAARSLLAGDVEVVVVSNSGPDKLVRWFDHGGVPHTLDPETRPGAVRLRGGARKFVLDGRLSERLPLVSVEIEVARPAYLEALESERPDAVVGDVFSLDLALPLALRRSRAQWRNLRLFWLLHPYTPAWLRAEIEAAAPEVEAIAGGLPAVAERLLNRR